MFYKEILLDHKSYTLQSITKKMQEQSGISFSYNAANINPTTKIRIKENRITVERLLSLIRKKSGIGYKIISKTHIIYTVNPTKKKRVTAKQKRRNFSAGKDISSNTHANIPLKVSGGDNVIDQQIVIVGDSTVASYYFSGGGNAGGSYSGHDVLKYPTVPDETEDNDNYDGRPGHRPGQIYKTSLTAESEVLNYIKSSVMLAAGVSADEVYYINPTVRAGFDFLYGIVSYNIGSYAHWRYGLGTSAKLNDRWTLHLNVSMGKNISASYNIQSFDTISIPPPPPDSSEQPIVVITDTPLFVQSKLNRFTLAAEYNLGRGFILGAGLTVNSLTSNYSSQGNPVKLSDLLPVGYDADQRYRTINPPYLLGNSYSASKSSNNKVWLGLQVTLVYRLRFFE